MNTENKSHQDRKKLLRCNGFARGPGIFLYKHKTITHLRCIKKVTEKCLKSLDNCHTHDVGFIYETTTKGE